MHTRNSEKALITGGSSGIGLAIAKNLYADGCSVVLVGRNVEKLNAAAEELRQGRYKNTKAVNASIEIVSGDVSQTEDCVRLYEEYGQQVDILVNCAGFGVYGEFTKTKIQDELAMLDVNCRGTHTLMKLFLNEMEKRDQGAILNVASSAGLTPGGPYMSAYYATKSYVVSLTRGTAEELRAAGSHVYVGVLCSGPVDTPFFDRAGIGAAVKGADPDAIAKAAVFGMKAGKTVIVPGWTNRLACMASKLLPGRWILSINRRIQAKKRKK